MEELRGVKEMLKEREEEEEVKEAVEEDEWWVGRRERVLCK